MKNFLIVCLVLCLPCVCFAPVSDFSKTVVIIEQACMRFNFSMSKAFALIYSEEDFKNITTYQGADKCRHYYGPGQICYETAKLKALHFKGKESDLKNPAVSIPLCVHYIKILNKQYHGNFEKVAAHYSGYVGDANRAKHFRRVYKLLKDVQECL